MAKSKSVTTDEANEATEMLDAENEFADVLADCCVVDQIWTHLSTPALAAVALRCNKEIFDRGMRQQKDGRCRDQGNGLNDGGETCCGCNGPLLADGNCAAYHKRQHDAAGAGCLGCNGPLLADGACADPATARCCAGSELTTKISRCGMGK